MSVGKVLATGVLTGLAVGTVLAILYRTEKGSKIRKQIMGKGNDLVDQSKHEATEALKKGKDNYENIKKQANDDVKLLRP